MAKRKKKEEPLEPEKVAEPLAKEPRNLLRIPIDKDDIRKEIDDIQHVARMVNIKHNTPGIKSIKKVVEYDVETRKITKAFYEIRK